MTMEDDSTKNSRSCECTSLQHSVCLESMVITLTIVSALAVTGEMLLDFHFFTVTETISQDNQSLAGEAPFQEDKDVMDILDTVFHYTSLCIAGLFGLEILLKIAFLRMRFLRHPWQILDIFVVSGTLGVEIAFHFLDLPYDSLYAVSYVVLLRLWRVPFVCNIRANLIREELEEDMELYRCGRQKAEERCSWLEENLNQQANIIKGLEQTLLGLKPSSMEDEESSHAETQDNSQPSAAGSHVTTNYGQNGPMMSEQPSVQSSRKDQNQKKRLHRSKKRVESDNAEMEMSEFHKDNSRPDHAGKRENIESSNFSESGTKRELKDKGDNSKAEHIDTSEVQLRPRGYSDNMLDFSNTNSLPRSEASLNSSSSTPRPGQINMRQRKRRSSTSEYIDYSNLSSPEQDKVFYDDVKDKFSSCPSLDHSTQSGEKERSVKSPELWTGKKKEVIEGGADEVDGGTKEDADNGSIKKTDSSTSDASSGVSSEVSVNGKRERRDRKKYKRFTSCPEYVITQRMSITNDESKLLDESHTTEDPSMYDNMAFLNDEDTGLHVLAEFDGSKTYRNEDGIPMTSL
ncbi:uncharacterized protein LOC101854637 [Aplysia californica]|uniref:Voltage-gated hydrogen channel 1 n=1 Tax=Aplysia californica TaxID=6500 RepID=A0ABM1VT50_APLCA|nr:uncharacterized protein LOC101854637 [Aplysia californica]